MAANGTRFSGANFPKRTIIALFVLVFLSYGSAFFIEIWASKHSDTVYIVPAYSPPPGCKIADWHRAQYIPRACDVPPYNNNIEGRYGLGYGLQYGHWIRVGNNAYDIYCDDFGGGPCRVGFAKPGKFRQK